MRWLKRLLHLSNCDWCGRVRRCEECRMGSYSRQRCRECRGVLGGLCTGEVLALEPIAMPRLKYLTYFSGGPEPKDRFSFRIDASPHNNSRDIRYALRFQAQSHRDATIAQVFQSAPPSDTPSVDAMVARISDAVVVTRGGRQFGGHRCYQNPYLPESCIVVCHPSAVTLFHGNPETTQTDISCWQRTYTITDRYTVVLTNRNLALVWGAESAAVYL